MTDLESLAGDHHLRNSHAHTGALVVVARAARSHVRHADRASLEPAFPPMTAPLVVVVSGLSLVARDVAILRPVRIVGSADLLAPGHTAPLVRRPATRCLAWRPLTGGRSRPRPTLKMRVPLGGR